MHHIISEVHPLSNYRLLAIFDSGEKKIYDVKPLFDWKDIFKKLKENELFYGVYVDTGGYGVAWNDQIDLSSNEIWNHGKTVKLDNDELDVLLADEALKEYKKNPMTYSHSKVKKIIDIDLELGPIKRRKCREFSEYYDMVWKEIDEHDE